LSGSLRGLCVLFLKRFLETLFKVVFQTSF
jgi:hypothetical protein